MVSRGLPNHLNSQRLREDSELYHFAALGQAKTSLFATKGACHALPTHQDRLCAPLPPLPFWSLGVGVSALAFAPWPTVSVLTRLTAGSFSSRRRDADYG